MEKYQKRNIAYKRSIKDIINSTYQKKSEEPGFIISKGFNVSRVNIIGFIVSFEDINNQKTYVLDDGSGKISLRIFNEISDSYNIGDCVLVIGWIREFNQEKYIAPEIIKKYGDLKWLEVRKKELNLIKDEEIDLYKSDKKDKKSELFKEYQTVPKLQNKTLNDSIIKEEELDIKEEDIISDYNEIDSLSKSDIIISMIREMDKGEGVFIDDILQKSDCEDTEKIILNLQKEGDIFEIRPGKVKVLE
jgi:RPA family protein